ncbi:MAG: extracellular solute-binding protein [Clostridiales bacterium]|jgi:putative aldouronate transport system substrate-binding protein|nr:extracellular solute-binding protein [Clostridiales bacterium]
MNKKLASLLQVILACAVIVSMLAGCGGGNAPAPTNAPAAPAATNAPAAPAADAPAAPEAAPEAASPYADLGLDANLRFTETRNITVEVYNRNNDGGTKPEDNFYTDYVKEKMLEKHNVAVTYIPVSRWTEGDEINNLLASGDAPDVCVTYSYPTIQTYASMGGVLDLAPYVDGYKEILPNLWDLLGDANIHWDQDPETKTIWALEAILFHNARINTFVREDWLAKLNIAEPASMTEFESMLQAFKDNASALLGNDADKIVPFSISYDAGWRSDHLQAAFIPNDISDKAYYVTGFDDRHFLRPNIKEAYRKINEWYNKDWVWKDFALYPSGDPTEDNMIKSGFVGSFMHNWDYPYRGGDTGIHATLKSIVGDDAAYIAVEPFTNDAGLYRKYLSSPIDRKVFFPSTNDEPIASALYLDWLSTLENRSFLQIGEEGVTHEVMPDGAIKTIATTGEKIMNSPNNIDMTIVINGLELGDPDLNIASLALGYAGVDARYIEKAYAASRRDGRVGKNVNVGAITAEEGNGPALAEKRDIILDNAIATTTANFDKVFDEGMQDYLNSGGQAILDEREAKWTQYFGTAEMLP